MNRWISCISSCFSSRSFWICGCSCLARCQLGTCCDAVPWRSRRRAGMILFLPVFTFRIDCWCDRVLFFCFVVLSFVYVMYVRGVCVCLLNMFSWSYFLVACSSCSLFTRLPTITICIHMRRATHVGVILGLQPWRHPSSFPFDSRWGSSKLQQVRKHRVDISSSLSRWNIPEGSHCSIFQHISSTF